MLQVSSAKKERKGKVKSGLLVLNKLTKYDCIQGHWFLFAAYLVVVQLKLVFKSYLFMPIFLPLVSYYLIQVLKKMNYRMYA